MMYLTGKKPFCIGMAFIVGVGLLALFRPSDDGLDSRSRPARGKRSVANKRNEVAQELTIPSITKSPPINEEEWAMSEGEESAGEEEDFYDNSAPIDRLDEMVQEYFRTQQTDQPPSAAEIDQMMRQVELERLNRGG